MNNRINYSRIDATVETLKKDWGEEWADKLFKLCADCGAGSLYLDVIPETDDEDERDKSIAAVDEYIKATYGVEV